MSEALIYGNQGRDQSLYIVRQEYRSRPLIIRSQP
jgi:hypothetical protein